MAIIFDTSVHKTLKQFAEENYPAECCAILGGTTQGGTRHCTDVYFATNQREEQAKSRRFEISPLELLKAEKYFRLHKLDTLGFFHTHPDHPAHPSEYDLNHASWTNYSYPIWSVRKGIAEDFNSFVLNKDRSAFLPETMEIRDLK